MSVITTPADPGSSVPVGGSSPTPPAGGDSTPLVPEPSPADVAIATPPIPAPPAPETTPPPAPDATLPPPPPPAPSTSPSSPLEVEDRGVDDRLNQLEELMSSTLPQILQALKVATPANPAATPAALAPPAESTHPTATVPEEGLSNPKVGDLVAYSYHDNVDGDVTLQGIVVAVPADPPDTVRVAWLGQLSGPLPAAHLTSLG